MALSLGRITRSATAKLKRGGDEEAPIHESVSKSKRSKKNGTEEHKGSREKKCTIAGPLIGLPLGHESIGLSPSEALLQGPFSLVEAQAHLAKTDPRFLLLFGRLPCGPFERLSISAQHKLQEPPDAFRNLCCSILGQQVSCSAARSISYKFLKLFFPDLPEKLNDPSGNSAYGFPSPSQVIGLPLDKLRTAGLSQRKAEYVRDLAQHFIDGRLDGETLMKMDPKRVVTELCAVRGIGRWTAEMFLIFCAKHPDILPHADLAIQKGIIRWYTAPLDPSILKNPLKSGSSTVTIKPEACKTETFAQPDLKPPQIPSGFPLSCAQLAGRLHKPVKSGLYLTPLEMEKLTEQWKPYRSLPVCYMWSLTGFIPEC